jgi:hypothetical protein
MNLDEIPPGGNPSPDLEASYLIDASVVPLAELLRSHGDTALGHALRQAADEAARQQIHRVSAFQSAI